MGPVGTWGRQLCSYWKSSLNLDWVYFYSSTALMPRKNLCSAGGKICQFIINTWCVFWCHFSDKTDSDITQLYNCNYGFFFSFLYIKKTIEHLQGLTDHNLLGFRFINPWLKIHSTCRRLHFSWLSICFLQAVVVANICLWTLKQTKTNDTFGLMGFKLR